MSTLLAVIKELWEFFITDCLHLTKPSRSLVLSPAPVFHQSIRQPSPAQALASNQSGPFVERSIATDTNQLLVAVQDAALHVRPVLLSDGVIEQLGYGTTIQVFGYEGRFARVIYKDQVGYILKDELADSTLVLPNFRSGHVYLADRAETIALRKYIKDEFNAIALSLPLQSTEFVTYRLASAGLKLPWGRQRPRLPGLWHQLLRGLPRVYIGVAPRTSAVMEYQADGYGQLGYVTAVTPDETVTVEFVGVSEDGAYEIKTLRRTQWQELRPVFIMLQ